MCECGGEDGFVWRVSGAECEVKVPKKPVDAVFLEPSVAASSKPPFEIAPEARCVPPNELASIAGKADGYVIIGAGKTALDTCSWLLEIGVPPTDIRWIKSREAWLLNRAFAQGGELVGTLFEGISLQVEAAAQATSLDDLFYRIHPTQQLLRVDDGVTPTMFKTPTVSAGELEQVRRIDGDVRLGKVRRLDRHAIVLDHGRVPTSPRHLHVHFPA